MIGINAATGKHLEGLDHLRQSIRDILTTPVGSRVMRRDYGSRLPRLVDAPLNDGTVLDLISATAVALARWEPRVDVRRVLIASAAPGRVELTIEARYLPDGSPITVDGIEVT